MAEKKNKGKDEITWNTSAKLCYVVLRYDSILKF